MQDYLQVLAFAALPAAGNLLCGVLAEIFRVSDRSLSLALHLAAGIVLAVVGIELMPQALQAEQPWVPVLAFVAGGGFFLLIDKAIDYIRNRFGGAASGAAMWTIYFGVVLIYSATV